MSDVLRLFCMVVASTVFFSPLFCQNQRFFCNHITQEVILKENAEYYVTLLQFFRRTASPSN